jgi:hypothetical protein
MKRILALLLGMTVFATPSIARHNDTAWLDAKVVAVGHVSSGDGRQIQSATIVLYDPGNAEPLAQQQVWAITSDAFSGRTKVNLSVGTKFKAYRTGETSRIYGFLVVQYVDSKGHEKSELHPILRALGQEDLPWNQ